MHYIAFEMVMSSLMTGVYIKSLFYVKIQLSVLISDVNFCLACGYIDGVTECKPFSKNRMKPYFNFHFQEDGCRTREVCFSPEKRKLLVQRRR